MELAARRPRSNAASGLRALRVGRFGQGERCWQELLVSSLVEPGARTLLDLHADRPEGAFVPFLLEFFQYLSLEQKLENKLMSYDEAPPPPSHPTRVAAKSSKTGRSCFILIKILSNF